MERIHRDIEANKDSYLALRKDYDRIQKHENMYNRPKDVEQSFREVKRRFKILAEQLIAPLFPGLKEHAAEQRQIKNKAKAKRKHGKEG